MTSLEMYFGVQKLIFGKKAYRKLVVFGILKFRPYIDRGGYPGTTIHLHVFSYIYRMETFFLYFLL